MENKELDTEGKILEAAKKVFVMKGFDGTRMQEIADEAGINKALLHYYFRSKELLFEAILNDVFKSFLPKVFSTMASEISFKEKIEFFCHTYIDMLKQNPYIPLFIMQEMNRNPGKLVHFMTSNINFKPELVFMMIQNEVNKGVIKPIMPQQLMINILSLCIFPIAARPMMQGIMFNNNEQFFDLFIEERKKNIAEFIWNAIKV